MADKTYLVRTDWEPRRDEFDRRLDFIDGLNRLRSTSLLVSGACLGYCGFLMGAFLGFYKQMVEEGPQNFLGQHQNHSYFPATVSEMVWNTSSGGGKCFFAFVLIGGICMLSSWYPWHLRNVYIGDDLMLFHGWLGNDNNGNPRGIRLLMLRQFLPPIGIMIVACIPAPPAANREFTDKVSSIVHTMGAVMSIGGYAFIELYTLMGNDLPVKFDTVKVYNKGWGEWRVRFITVLCCLLSIGAFQMFGVLCSQAHNLGICCEDVWEIPTKDDLDILKSSRAQGFYFEDEIAVVNHQHLLKQTASGTFVFLKLGQYWFEVLSGLFMLYSHLVIWWYCPERHIDLDEELPDPDGEEGAVYRLPSEVGPVPPAADEGRG